MKLLAEIGVILSILSRAIFRYGLFPIILLTVLAFLFPEYFYVVPYRILAWGVSITIVSFVLYILVFGILEIVSNKCLQRKMGENRGFQAQHFFHFYPIEIDKVIRMKRIGRIRKGMPGAVVSHGFNLQSNKPLTVLVIAGIFSLSLLLSL